MTLAIKQGVDINLFSSLFVFSPLPSLIMHIDIKLNSHVKSCVLFVLKI